MPKKSPKSQPAKLLGRKVNFDAKVWAVLALAALAGGFLVYRSYAWTPPPNYPTKIFSDSRYSVYACTDKNYVYLRIKPKYNGSLYTAFYYYNKNNSPYTFTNLKKGATHLRRRTIPDGSVGYNSDLSVSWVNGGTGTLFPVRKISTACY